MKEALSGSPVHIVWRFAASQIVPICKPACRLQRTKRLRHLFEEMDKHRTGALTLEQFQEYMARENPKSLRKAATLFKAMASNRGGCSMAGGDACPAVTVTFLEVHISGLL
jgi:hypothetical protein